MSAITFIKQHGVDRAREVVEGAPTESTHFEFIETPIYMQFCGGDWFWFNTNCNEWLLDYPKGITERRRLEELKRLVDSVDIITKVGGIHEAIEEHTKWMHAPELHLYRIGESEERLKQAIADYEAIYSGVEQ